jgi:hypothetical protein
MAKRTSKAKRVVDLDDVDDGAVMAGDQMAVRIPLAQGDFRALDDSELTEPDQAFVAEAGIAVRGFLNKLGAFFTEARALEAKATQTLGIAKELDKIGTPATMAADEGVQLFIKSTNDQRKAAEEHWSITTKVSQFHRRLTARRAVTTDALEEANTIANKLHNSYVANEERRIAREADEKRRALEAEERRRREAEAEAAAREAERIELDAPEVKPRELAFINYYIAEMGRPGCDARAAQLAGYKSPADAAMKLLASPKIIAALEARRQADEIRRQQDAKARAPISVDVPREKPLVSRSAGLSSRTRWGADVLDAQALTNAVFVNFGEALASWIGKPVPRETVADFLKAYRGEIPRDVLAVDESAVRKYGESLHELIDRWPGVRHTKNTKGV